jgi:hypothetical protein
MPGSKRKAEPQYEVVKDGVVLHTVADRDYALQLVSGLNGAELREAGAAEEEAE